MELITGATGYVGSRLTDRLLSEGRSVRALARDPARLTPREGLQVARGDLLTGEGLRAALEGCSTAYYLVHSMEPSSGGEPFADRDRRAAETFASAAAEAGVDHLIYLGGLVPAGGPSSDHLASRLEVEQILLGSVPAATALRASVLVGAWSSSFRILVRLVERLRVMPVPAWRDRRTQPIAEHDAIEFLARTPHVPAAAGRSLDIAGPDVVSYGELLRRIAELMGLSRMPVGVGAGMRSSASAVVSAVCGQPLELVRPLMDSLERDLLPRDAAEAPLMYGIQPLPLERAVERALAEWERDEELAAR